MRKLLVLLLSLSLSLSASLYVPDPIGSLSLVNFPLGMAVLKDNKIRNLEPQEMDSHLRKMTFEQREKYIEKGGSLSINQTSDGAYILRVTPKLKGGGPILANTFYWLTKVLGYTCVTVASTAVVAGAVASATATGGAAAPIIASAGSAALAATKIATVAAATAGTAMTGGAVTATGIVIHAAAAGATAGGAAAAATAAATTATAGIATAGATPGIVAGIEALSMSAYLAGYAFPWW